jgi:superfamily II DNA or RNA helicase
VSWENLHNLLEDIFGQSNAENNVPSPRDLWDLYGTQITELVAELNTDSGIMGSLTQLGDGIWSPKPVEAARLLRLLKLRRQADSDGNPLVGRLRSEVMLRRRPPYNVRTSELNDPLRQIGDIAGHDTYSEFQVDGWNSVLEAIQERSSLVITAPTGGGKTEVFLLPIIYHIANSIQTQQVPNRFVFLYPRVELLKDQLGRIFKYVHSARQQNFQGQTSFLQDANVVNEEIVIGLQFSGIRSQHSGRNGTFSQAEIFENQEYFKVVDQCPICAGGRLRRASRVQGGVTTLQCENNNCRARFHVSIAKRDHCECHPHILVTTAESLDRLYLTPRAEFENYLRTITGLVFDEVHVYDSLYGVHIFNLIQSLEDLCGHPLTRIASSATVSSPERFAAKLFYGNERHSVAVHEATEYEMETNGLEVIYFIQSPEEERSPSTASTLIQTVMAAGHGLLEGDQVGINDKRGIVFTESVDLAGRLGLQIRDAESREPHLWSFRTLLDDIIYQGSACPATDPISCSEIYLQGECWRGILGGSNCTDNIGVKERPLEITVVTSKERGDFWQGDILVATPTLEVGVDDDNMQATFHYRPPRTVFNFIQRRGRAGRKEEDIAYTFMVLGNASSDQFYFFRRHRLLLEDYELPLNPQNPIVRSMHNSLDAQRQRLRDFIARRSNVSQGILLWILHTLNECPAIQRYYGNDIDAILQRDYRRQKAWFLEWVTEELRRFESYLNLKLTLDEIEDTSPNALKDAVNEVRSHIERYLSGEQENESIIEQEVIALQTDLGTLATRERDRDTRGDLLDLQSRIINVWSSVRERIQFEISLDLAEGFYDFFRAINAFNEAPNNWTLNYEPEALKTILQAFFYLGLVTHNLPDHQNCPSCLDYFIPDAYFQKVKPLIVEVRDWHAGGGRELEQEKVTDLASLFLPYNVAYRYHYPHLSTVRTRHNLDWVEQRGDQTIINLELGAEGIRSEDILQPKKVYIRRIRGDRRGQGVVRMCLGCYSLHNESQQTPCCSGYQLVPVKLYSQAIVSRVGHPIQPPQPISRMIDFFESLEGQSRVDGADVVAHQMYWTDEDGYQYTSRSIPFQALYRTPVSYNLATKGIGWRLEPIVSQLLQDADLVRQLEEIQADKNLTPDLILHTAAHMLYKAIASISGVNQEELEYAINADENRIIVWERYEGGAGISEIIRDTLHSEPEVMYKELLASVICPVNLAEENWWSDRSELIDYLVDEWKLRPSNEMLNSIVQNAESERIAIQHHDLEENRGFCTEDDGCPVCLHVNSCTAGREQRDYVSHLVAEAIMHCLVKEVTRAELEGITEESLQNDIIPPHQLRADPQVGEYNVLLL